VVIVSETEAEILNSNFSVILKADLPPLEFELLSHYARRVVSDTGKELLHFACTKVEDGHHYYLSIESFLPGTDITDSLRIPHHYVLFISGGEDRRQIGFIHGD
jgi:hypothetical protein